MIPYFDLEAFTKEIIDEYLSALGALKTAKDPMQAVAVALHKDLEEMGDDWRFFRCGMLAMFVYLEYVMKEKAKELSYIR